MWRRLYVVLLGIALAGLGCSSATAAIPPAQPASPNAGAATITPITGEITVFAASSLTDAFNEMGERFRAANPGASVNFNFGASTQLFTQIDQGAQADVFASADQVQMDRAKNGARIDGPDQVFATNRLVVITPASNPGSVRTLGDLARPGVKLVTSQEDVPIGVYTQAIFQKMSQNPQFGAGFTDRVNANIVSREANVRQIVAKVQLGEADAGVVYKTDVTPQAAGQLATIEVADELNTLATYPIAVVKGNPNFRAAEAFITFVLSPDGQATMAKWNFVAVR